MCEFLVSRGVQGAPEHACSRLGLGEPANCSQASLGAVILWSHGLERLVFYSRTLFAEWGAMSVRVEGSCSPEGSFSPLCGQNLSYRLAEWGRQAELLGHMPESPGLGFAASLWGKRC